MQTDRRRYEILALIERSGEVRIHDLAKLFDVTEMTIRRDLNRLSELGFIKRIHGGAEAGKKEDMLFHITVKGRTVEYIEEKRQIGEKAVRFVEAGKLIFIHGGSTTLELARRLPEEVNLQVMTNSLQVMEVLSEKENVDLLCTGGILNRISNTYYGPHSELLLDNTNIDILFMGSNGVSITNGLSEFDFNVASLKKKIIERSKLKILLVDSHKFNVERSSSYARIEDFDVVITDDKVDRRIYDRLEELNIRVIV
ncbi:MAG: DeoR/GlpR transcriptional regulator [Spirochaetes bacterium]|nr:DeoR/GlpR transcriptional regulator [Spirochaetota bacterium]